ncbi:hypothetical protein DCAR_0310639 [Daucus carota subsp. sativus]|uniref:Cucumisin n=1 Tax=Daucus carota subsp. sativus TaxID=79200 RepID=A0AAF0WNT4_DAUCS|nr:hypothetical protein DCAR_0310639 [Daucus carota subsp. sativus]
MKIPSLLVLDCHCYEDNKVHIVYMGDLPKGKGGESVTVQSMHHNILTQVLGSPALAKESLVHSYGRSFNGFVARLSDKEAAKIRAMESVVSVFPNTVVPLHTTRSWNFLRFPESHPVADKEGDIIIGMLDTGIWPESKSFIDTGYGPPPAKWKGICQTGNNFTCNNKVIGARFYDADNSSDPEYDIIHGSHTASTAAGELVYDTSYHGIAAGDVRGAVPNARIAVYKVCWTNGCASADILAAFDDAIADGVDLLSVSFGSVFPIPYHEEPISIGSFHAMKNGILTSCSAGDNGPYRREIANYFPWALTVGASTIDRLFVTKVVLGNGQQILGNSLNSFYLGTTTFPLVYSGDAGNVTFGVDFNIARLCIPGTLNTNITKGGILLCDKAVDGEIVTASGAVGMIAPAYNDFISYAFAVPAVIISPDDYESIIEYTRTAHSPTATIFTTVSEVDVMAPTVADFSGRGPNPISPNILKPDLTAPGVNIFAAWSPLAFPSVDANDPRQEDYYIVSGTSMSCPHATGAAAYVKSFHPSWSPAAIKSALMTTATIVDPRKNEDGEFAYGSGQINPIEAVDPGLIFNASEADFVNFLCAEGYNSTLVGLISGDSSTCPGTLGKATDLNYPSFALSLLDGEQIDVTYPRTVTNVGSPNSTYFAWVTMPPEFTVVVEPSTLTFGEVGDTKSFTVRITGSPLYQVPLVSGSIQWTDGTHNVRTPIALFNNMPTIWASLGSTSPLEKNTQPWNAPAVFNN